MVMDSSSQYLVMREFMVGANESIVLMKLHILN